MLQQRPDHKTKRRRHARLPESWDAIVVGASFGGLAAAGELAGAGRVLLLDRKPIGEGQTSACATPLAVLERLEAGEALEQVHHTVVFHFGDGRTHRFQPRYPFAAFDYGTLCELLYARTTATFLEARVHAFSDGLVMTSRGSFRAPVVIDASGWRAAAASTAGAEVAVRQRSLGLETRLAKGGEGLHFWIRPRELPCGAAWLFPAGPSSRAGVACYLGTRGLQLPLEQLFRPSRLAHDRLHGGVFPAALREPVVGDLFVVGDAAGQCLPITGEGIRPALVFGQQAGRLARAVLEDRLSLDAALRSYRGFVLARRPAYRLLAAAQQAMLRSPPRLLPAASHACESGPLAQAIQTWYWRIAAPELLAASPPTRFRLACAG